MSDYLLKANIILALLYAFYRLSFYKDTFFNYRRISLMGILAVAALIPLPWTQLWVSTWPAAGTVGTFTTEVLLPEFVVTPEKTGSTATLLTLATWIYWSGVCLLLGRIGIQLLAIIRLNHRCPRTQINGMTIRTLPEGEAPFSFFSQIFVCPTSHTPEELDEILTHEQTHARQAHSLDVLVAEVACALGWFNPFVWLWKREVRQNLEYLADQSVLAEGHDRRTYQYHLLGLAYHFKKENPYDEQTKKQKHRATEVPALRPGGSLAGRCVRRQSETGHDRRRGHGRSGSRRLWRGQCGETTRSQYGRDGRGPYPRRNL